MTSPLDRDPPLDLLPKTCAVCKRIYKTHRAWLALPHVVTTWIGGLLLEHRACACHNTLVMPIAMMIDDSEAP